MVGKPSSEEEARKNLDARSWAVDYITTHSPPNSLVRRLIRPQNELTDFLEEVRQKGGYCRRMFDYCHENQTIDEIVSAPIGMDNLSTGS